MMNASKRDQILVGPRQSGKRLKKKVLVIDGGAEMRRNLMTILRLEKFHPLPAENGRVGLELARSEKPDLILSDIVMPELDGYGVITALRADAETFSIPFIFVTAKAEKRDVRIALKLGADDYLIKPVAKPDLLEAIHSRLERAALRSDRVQAGGRSLPSQEETPLSAMSHGSI